MSGRCDVGLYGLAVMGINLSLNIASKGFKICVCNRTVSKVETALEKAQAEGLANNLIGAKSTEEFIGALKKPRRVLMMIHAGPPVDELIRHLLPHLEKGDCLIDGGNEFYKNTERRERLCAEKGIWYLGLGVSGGEEGARYGPSLMPGGSREAYELMKPIFLQIAAKIKRADSSQQQQTERSQQEAAAVEESDACVAYMGPGGAGNFVKMIHNGIEYGDMQLIAEAYYILKYHCGLTNAEMHDVFEGWNNGDLNSYLIQITSKILLKEDSSTGGYLLDYISDAAESKGTGKWTVQQAAEAGVAIPTIAAALDMRYISDDVTLREKLSAARAETWPSGNADAIPTLSEDYREETIADIGKALLCSKVCCYAQGFQVLAAVSEREKWNLNLAEVCRVWKEGCIIRAAILDIMMAAFSRNPSVKNLLLDSQIFCLCRICALVKDRIPSLQRIVAASATPSAAEDSLCIPLLIPCHSASYFYLAAISSSQLPTNLIQAQRDCFGAHTFKRIDCEGVFHEEKWLENA